MKFEIPLHMVYEIVEEIKEASLSSENIRREKRFPYWNPIPTKDPNTFISADVEAYFCNVRGGWIISLSGVEDECS